MGIASRFVDAGCYKAPAVPCSLDTVEPLDQLLLGNGGGLTNVNADYLGHIPAAGYAQTSGSYQNMNVGTATFAVTAGNALNLGGIPSSGYVKADDTRVVHAITNLYWTGSSGSVTVSGNTGTINFGSGGGGIGGTNLWLLNNGTALTNDELEIVTAGGLTGVLSNYSGRVQLTLSNTTSAGTVTYAESSGYATNPGSAAVATSAGMATNATYATSAETATNATQLNGVAAEGYATTNLIGTTSNTLAAATLAVTNGLPTTATVETARINAIATNKVANATFADTGNYATNALYPAQRTQPATSHPELPST